MRRAMGLRIGLLCAAALSVAGCSGQGAAEADAQTASAATAQSADVASAEAFVRSLYEGSVDLSERSRAAEVAATAESGRIEESDIWSARTKALIAETDRLTPEGFIGFFESEPICDCQDGEPILTSAKATLTSPTSADVAVVQGFRFPDSSGAEAVPPVAEAHRKTYKLIWENGGWHLDDMTYEDMGADAYSENGVVVPREPLVQRLNAWIADVRSDPKAFSGE